MEERIKELSQYGANREGGSSEDDDFYDLLPNI